MKTFVRTRFAPSPTGYLHVGGARTALFSWLFAKKHGGTFVLRVEDTDQARNTEEAREAIFQGLSWMGLDWEGPGNEGDVGPYYQSERTALYEEWFQRLVKTERVYEQEGAWYFRFERKSMRVEDLVCGTVEIDFSQEYDPSKSAEENRNAGYIPDLVVRRSDGSFVFHFVNVVDDLSMGITHVIRGEDHLMNTPKHLQLIEAFGEKAPQYAHIPLILNQDGSKMSKRDQGASVAEYEQLGFLPEAVNNFFSLLGWSSKTDEELFSLEELTKKFSLEQINRSPAKFDYEKCVWVNQQHILRLEHQDFIQKARAVAPEASDAMLLSIREKVALFSEVPEAVAFFLTPDYPFEPEAFKRIEGDDLVIALLKQLAENLTELSDWSQAKSAVMKTAKEQGVKPGKLMFPLRVALSGKSGGPDLEEILIILGKEQSVSRIKRCLALLA